MRIIKLLTWLFLFGFGFGVLAIVGAYFYVRADLPNVEQIKYVELQTPMQVYSADGKLISQFGEKKRIPLKYNEIPEKMKQAILATEDARFYEHIGVDFIGIARAMVAVVTSGTKKQGASTITMQVARNFFLSREKTYIRKIKEIFIALHIEQLLTKQEILALYLNKIELGYRAFGVGAAAEVYYGKAVDELTLPEIAMISGLPKAPSALNPVRNPKRAKERRNTVLWRMLQTEAISQAEYQQAIETPLTAKRHGAQIELDAPYIAEMTRQFMLDLYGEEAYTNGYQVFTTISNASQVAAQQAIRNNLHAYDERHGYRGEIKELWIDGEEQPFSRQEIQVELKRVPEFGQFKNVVITKTDLETNHFEYIDKQGNDGLVEWSGIKWARPFVSDRAQGKAPNGISDVLRAGLMVSVRNVDGQWRLAQMPAVEGALIVLDPFDGAVRALMGGYDFRESEYNRATLARRQPGSNIKPFIYGAALDNGFTLASIVNDAPINQWDRRQGTAWRPKNSPEKYDGPIRIRDALAKSKNVVSVRLLRSVGISDVVDYLGRFGFNPHDLPRNESLALGSAEFTPYEVATAYTPFVNGGYLVDPYFVEKVLDAEGNIVWQAEPKVACEACLTEATLTAFSEGNEAVEAEYQPSAEQVISEQTAFLIADAMQTTIWGGGDWNRGTGWNGTGWRARVLKRKDIGGKTGTTNEAKDTWFSGYAGGLVITSWVGFDDHKRTLGMTSYNSNLGKKQIYGKEFGAKTALPAWVEYIERVKDSLPVKSLPIPTDLITVRIDEETGRLTNRVDHSSVFEFFTQGTAPTLSVNEGALPDILNAEAEGEVIEEPEEIF